MDTHIQGRIEETNQLGAIPSLRGFQFNFTDITNQLLCTVSATPTDPVLLEIWPTILVPFNAGTTNVVQVFDQNGNILVTFPDPTSTGVQSYINILVRQKTKLIILYSYTGTPPTTGNGILMARVSGLGKGVGIL